MKFLVGLVALAAVAQCAQAGPIEKVIELLGNLKTKITEEGEAAAKDHVEFREFCRSTIQDTEHSIVRNKDKIEQQQAIIAKAAGDIEAGTAAVAELAGQIQQDTADLEKATALRKKENEDFLAAQKELEEGINMLARAIGILRKAGLGFPQLKEALTQVTSTLSLVMDSAAIDLAGKQKLQALLQAAKDDDDDDDEEKKTGYAGDPQAAKYESHSAGIIEAVEELGLKAKAELMDLQKTEMKRQHDFDMLKQSLTDSLATAERDRKNHQDELATNTELKGKAEGALAEASDALSSNEKLLQDRNAECDQEAEDYKNAVASRNEELEAISKAVQILTDPKFAAATAARGASFLDLSHTPRLRAVGVLRGLARKYRSVELATIAVRAGEDTFGKIKGLIRDMIKRLQKQAAEESSHNAFCVKEKKENTQKRDKIMSQKEKFEARLEAAKAEEGQLKEEIAQLSSDIVALDKAVAEAIKLRQEQNSAFIQASDEFRIGLDGLQRAIKVLEEYYAVKDAGHKKASDSASGIISMLEVAESDMTNAQTEAELVEKNAQSAFDKSQQQAKIDKAKMEATVKSKEGEVARIATRISDLQSDVDGASEELDAVLKYLEELRGKCEHKPMTFAERAARRQAEIDGLKEALRILEEETASDDEGAAEGFLQRRA
jgi:hypothetical protein